MAAAGISGNGLYRAATLAPYMDLSRRRFLVLASRSLVVGGAGLLAACQSGPQGPATIVVSGATSTPAAAQPAVQPSPASPVAGASPAAGASPSPAAQPAASPAASPVAAASPAAAASPQPAAAAGNVAGKPQYQMDALHTGRSPYAGPRRMALLRTFDTTDPADRPADQATITSPDIQSSTAVGPDGTIYVTTFSGWSYALKDSPTRQGALDMVWRFRPTEGGGPFHGTAAVSRDGALAYVPYTVGAAPNQKAVVYALRAFPGGPDAVVVWAADAGAGQLQNSVSMTNDGTLYVVNVSGLISAIDSTNGRAKWTAQIGTSGPAMFGQTVKVAPAVAPDGTVYVTAVTGSMYAVTPPSGSGTQGSVKWSFDFGQHLGSQPVPSTPVTNGGNRGQDGIGSAASVTIGPDGTLYVGASNSNFYAIDPNGNQKWLFEAERELAGIWTTACLSPDASVLYFGANRGGIYALNTRDGSLKWQFPIFGSVYSSSALDARGVLYTGSTVGSVYAIDSASGEKVDEYSAGSPVWTAPSIRPDGSIAVVDRMGRVLVLGQP